MFVARGTPIPSLCKYRENLLVIDSISIQKVWIYFLFLQLSDGSQIDDPTNSDLSDSAIFQTSLDSLPVASPERETSLYHKILGSKCALGDRERRGTTGTDNNFPIFSTSSTLTLFPPGCGYQNWDGKI